MRGAFDMWSNSNNTFIKHVDHYINGAAQAGFSMTTTNQPLPLLPLPPPPQTSSLNTDVLSVGGVPEEEIEFFMKFNPSAASLTPPVASASTSAATPAPLTPPAASPPLTPPAASPPLTPPAASTPQTPPAPAPSATASSPPATFTFHAVPPPQLPRVNAVMVTTLSTKQIQQIEDLEQHVAASERPMTADRVGLLYYTLSGDPSQGLSLLSSTDDNRRLIGFNFLIDPASQLNVINEADVLLAIPNIDWLKYPSTINIQPVGSNPFAAKATLPIGTLNLIIGFQSANQTILRLEWIVIAGDDKKGTPILGTGVFATLEADWRSAKHGKDNQGSLKYTTHQGLRGELPLLYTTHRQLPQNQTVSDNTSSNPGGEKLVND